MKKAADSKQELSSMTAKGHTLQWELLDPNAQYPRLRSFMEFKRFSANLSGIVGDQNFLKDFQASYALPHGQRFKVPKKTEARTLGIQKYQAFSPQSLRPRDSVLDDCMGCDNLRYHLLVIRLSRWQRTFLL